MKSSGLVWLRCLGALAAGLFTASCDHGPVLQEIERTDDRPLLDRCGTHEPSAIEKDLIERQLEGYQRVVGSGLAGANVGPTTVPVWVHNIRKADGTGALTTAQIAAQIAALNTSYGGGDTFSWDGRSVTEVSANTTFRFALAGTTVSVNDLWFAAGLGSTDERNLKNALRVGGPETLNLYTTSGGGYLGWATFPTNYAANPKADGVILAWDTLPGTRNWAYAYGDTATHEVGHWLGLYHTFQGGCSGAGDEVADTPADKAATYGCPSTQPDTCNGPGRDPIYNFMDYTDDRCMFVFSSGQSGRMSALYDLHRRVEPECVTGADCDDGNACTTDTCNASTGCASSPVADGAACDDGDACTSGDACAAGACTGALVCGPDPVIFVADLDRTAVNNGSRWNAQVVIEVRDAADGLVSGATVAGTWGSTSASCVTGATGRCTASLNGIGKKTTSVVFRVTDVSKAGLGYDATGNSDPDGDSDGTSITVSKP